MPARHGRRQAPEEKSKTYSTGFFHIDLAEIRTGEGKLYLFVASLKVRKQGRMSKFAVVELVEKADMQAAAAFLEGTHRGRPVSLHTVLTDNGIQFADRSKNRQGQPHASMNSRSTSVCHSRDRTPAHQT